MLFVNFKTYEEGSGQKAFDLVKALEDIATQIQIKIIPAVQLVDAESIVNTTKLEVWVQHLDPISYGAHTGQVLPESLVRIGVTGVFLNHSERKFEDFEKLAKAVRRAEEVGLKTLVFAGNLDELRKVLEIKPTFVAYEPPELIGSTETSVARAQPEIIEQAVNACRESGIPLIVGAGINSQEDVRKSVELGAVGVVVATAIVKADDPRQKTLELLS